METKKCFTCNEEKSLDKFVINPNGEPSPTCGSCYAKKHRAKIRLGFLKEFDFKCSCCGETEVAFLTLDHVMNDGNVHRKAAGYIGMLQEAKREGWPRDKYTCLCYNCNQGRAKNGICPHKESGAYLEKLKIAAHGDGLRKSKGKKTKKEIQAKQTEWLKMEVARKTLGLTREQMLEIFAKAGVKL
jgi:hypothetical protein